MTSTQSHYYWKGMEPPDFPGFVKYEFLMDHINVFALDETDRGETDLI